MPRERKIIDEDAVRRRRIVTALFLAFGLVLLLIGHFGGKRRRLPFARTKLPGPASSEAPLAIEFAPEGDKVLVVARDALRVYVFADLALGGATPLFTVDKGEGGLTFEGTVAAALSGNGRELVLARAPGKSAELDVVGIERALLTEKVPLDPVTTIALSNNGLRAVTGGTRAELWDLTQGTRLAALETKGGPVAVARLSPDEKRAVVVASERKTIVWDLASQATRETGVRLAPAIFTASGAIFGLTTSGAFLWEPERGEPAPVDAGGHAVRDLARFGAGSRVVGVDEKSVVLWDLEAKKLVREVACDRTDVGRFESIAASPRGDAVVVGTRDGEVLWLDVAE